MAIGISLFVLLVSTGAASYVYVVNSNSNNVSVIDTGTNTVIATVDVGRLPEGIAISPDGTRVYVANRVSLNVSVIDTVTNKVVDTINLIGRNPWGVAISPDGKKLYVADENSANVSVIDTISNKVINTVDVGTTLNGGILQFSALRGIVVIPNGTKIYVANWLAGIVSIIDAVTNNVTAIVSIPHSAYRLKSSPWGIAASPDGTKVYVTDDNNLSVIDTATETIKSTTYVSSSLHEVAVNPDGTKVYVAGNYHVYSIDTNTNVVTIMGFNTPWGIGSFWGVTVNSDGTKVYATYLGNGTVSVIDTITDTVTGVNVGNGPKQIAILPTPLTVNITTPANNDYSEELVNFSGTANGGIPPYTYTWTSDKDGTLNTATTANTLNEFSKNLTMGTHNISLTVQDSVGNTETKTITLNVVKQKIKLLIVPVTNSNSISPEEQAKINRLNDDTKEFYLKSSYGKIYLDFTVNPTISTKENLQDRDAVVRDTLTQLLHQSQYNTIVIFDTGAKPEQASAIPLIGWSEIVPYYRWPFINKTGTNGIRDIMGNQTLMYPQTVVFIPANNKLGSYEVGFGSWVHEIGHTLGYTVQTSETTQWRALWGASDCMDLYNCGTVDAWDVMAKGVYVYNNSQEDKRINRPTDMSILSKTKLGWLTKEPIVSFGDYPIMSTENMLYGDQALVYKPKHSSNVEYYIEARELIQPSYYMWSQSLDKMDGTGKTKIFGWSALSNGILIYKVSHNNFFGDYGDTSINPLNTTRILDEKPTLLASDGTSASYSDCEEFVEFGVSDSHPDHPYRATIKIGEPSLKCKSIEGVILTETRIPTSSSWLLLSNITATLPNLDLHAYTPDGKHVGMNYTSGEYEMQILGAASSGNLIGGEEWIFVPTGTQVRYSVDSHDVQKFLEENPEVNASNATMEYSTTIMEYGENPQLNQLPDGNWTVTNRTVSEPKIETIEPNVTKEIDTTPTERFINGTVMDSVNKMPLSGVTVSTNTTLTNTTNATGFYSFAVTEGEYNLTAKFEPTYYANNTITVSTIGSDVVQNIELLKKPMGTITGKVTGTPGGITVLSPNGGENWRRGTAHAITWNYTGNPGTNVTIELFKNGVFNRTIFSTTPNDKSQSWNIPTTQTLGTDYKIKITSTTNLGYNDISDNNFRISI